MATEEELQEKFEKARDAHESRPGPKSREAMEQAMQEFAVARTQRKALEAVDPNHPRNAAGAPAVEAGE